MSLKKCKAVLVSVDFSPDSVQAAQEAVIIAQAVGSKLVVLHVVHDPGDAPGFYHKKKAGKKILQQMSDAAAEMMEEFLKENALNKKSAGIDVETMIVRGLPSTQIVQAAKKTDACLVVMGSSGKTGLAHLLVGSTAERVVQMSPIPVMVVKQAKK